MPTRLFDELALVDREHHAFALGWRSSSASVANSPGCIKKTRHAIVPPPR